MRFKYLDVLKFIAILAVVLYHSGFLTFGYLGVDLFLVINGYLITRSLLGRFPEITDGQHKRIANGLNRYADFELSRVVRLLPILLIGGCICMTFGFYTMLPDDYENLSESVVATNLFGNNILAAITTKNYWNVVNEYKPLMHTWYVGLLMQFYLVYPLLFLLANIDKKNSRQTLLVVISTLAVISLFINLGTSDEAHRFYYLPSRYFEFAVGGIAAFSRKHQNESRSFHDWFVYVCYALMIALLVLDLNFIPTNIRLLTLVALSVVLVLSNERFIRQMHRWGHVKRVV